MRPHPERAAFLRDLVAEAVERDWLALWFRSWTGIRFCRELDLPPFQGKEGLRGPGWIPFRKDHVGQTLMFRTGRGAADGLQEVHFLRGDQPHKNRLPNRDSPVFTWP